MALLLALNGLNILAITDYRVGFFYLQILSTDPPPKLQLYIHYLNLKLRFLNTKLNIADYLSRGVGEHLCRGGGA